MTESSRARRFLFPAVALALPVIFFAALEGALRLAWPAGAMPAFERLPVATGERLVPSRFVARRYFPSESLPPAPPRDAFAAEKGQHTFRLFVLGESAAAGFPYPANGTFSRVLQDALRDVLPDETVEVVNVAIAATNSYTMVDLSRDVLAQHPDAVLVYAGHNEYYGALGVGSSIRMGSSPALVRAYLAALHLRTVALVRRAIVGIERASHGAPRDDPERASFMESVARDQQIALGSAAYEAGLAQFSSNMGVLLRRFRGAGVPVFVASVASNARDQHPFAAEGNGPAVAAFDSARAAAAAGDSAGARRLYLRARELDVVRFRAPAPLNDTIRALAAANGAHYVPVAERFASLSPSGVPGGELFLEHVHPNRHGYALIGRAFFDALRDARFLGHPAHRERLASWDEYERRMSITPFDERIVQHTVRTLTTRWPFVPRAQSIDYRGTYRPTDVADSLALLVSRGGISWADAKLRVAAAEERQHPDQALAEYLGLLRDLPLAEPPWRLVGRTLVALGRGAEARPYLEQANALATSWESTFLLGDLALAAKDYPRAIVFLDSAVTLLPTSARTVFKLSVAFGQSGNAAAARAAAARTAQLDPALPGLATWMAALGMRSSAR